MDSEWKEIIWQQFCAAIDMLENAMQACSEELWKDRSVHPEFWYVSYHTLFWLDLQLSDSADRFVPSPPFTLSELDPKGLLPERVYTKNELQTYLVNTGLQKNDRERIAQGWEIASRNIRRIRSMVMDILYYTKDL